jgi:hypothetical protein
MSTSVTREEWATLTEVPRALYKSHPMTGGEECHFRCDVEPSHGSAVVLMQTPDHRAIALCHDCLNQVKLEQMH